MAWDPEKVKTLARLPPHVGKEEGWGVFKAMLPTLSLQSVDPVTLALSAVLKL